MYSALPAAAGTLVRTGFLAVTVLSCLVSLAADLRSQEVGSDDPVAVFNQAQDLHEKGDLSGAIALYAKALAIMPEFPEAEYQRGIAFLALGKPDDAERAYRRAVEIRPEWTLATAALGGLLVQRGEYAEAEKLLMNVLAMQSSNPPALTAMVDLRLKTKAAEPVLRDLLSKIIPLTAKASPTAALWTARAALEFALSLNREAKASLTKALSIDPKDRNALFHLADIALAEGDLVRANALAARLDAGKPSTDLLVLKANILAQEGKFDEALAMVGEVGPTHAGAADLRKRIAATRSTDPVEVESNLAADPKNVAILSRLCVLYRKEHPAKSLEYCRRASEAEPNNVNHAVGFAAALVQAKQYDAAVALLTKLIEVFPDNATARANLGTALFQLKRYNDAKEQFRWLTAAQPRSAAAYLFLGIAHDELEEYSDAAANYQQYLRLADPVENKLDIDKINLRMPALQKLIKQGKGKRK
ncbi:MAG: tetratricopeptide repeat protein [Pyrinomonadaceae bacterium]